MARLTDLVNESATNTITESEELSLTLIEGLESIINLVEEGTINESELEDLLETFTLLSEVDEDLELAEDEITDEDLVLENEETIEEARKRTSNKKKLAAKQNYKRNKAKILKARNMIKKRFKNAVSACKKKIAGKDGLACGTRGKMHKKMKNH
jgi:hypothetical protein